MQEVLDVVGGGLDRLEISAGSVKLLVCCYYYVKEEECAERVREMVEKIKASGERCWGGGKGRGRDGGEEVKSKRLKAESLTGDSGCAPSGAGGDVM